MHLGIACDQRYRDYMEDRVATGPAGEGFVVGVFDGHGGSRVAERAAAHAVKLVDAAVAGGTLAPEAMWAEVFAGLDATDMECGSTATVLFARSGELSVAWVGDSRAVLVTRTASRVLTPDHRLEDARERRRVVGAGALIDLPYAIEPRSGRGLMVTRSLGDHELRRIGIMAEPEVTTLPLGAGDVGFVAATDGLWDVVANEEAADICRDELPQAAADRLVQLVIARDGSDNVTVVVGRF